jgi:hypothetical protein
MVGNPLISDGKQRPSSLTEVADNLSENFDASVKHSRPPPSPTDRETVAILKEDRELQYSDLKIEETK